MPTEEELLAGIVAAPRETERWLVLADWLEDQGDPRAELARLRYLLHAEPDHPETARRAARQMELLDAGLAPVVPTLTTFRGMRFALVLPGSFWMGSPTSDDLRSSIDDEILHQETVADPFFLGVYPVTVAEFERFVKATGYQTDAERGRGAWGFVGDEWTQDATVTWRTPGFKQTGRHPVVCVSWNDAQALCAWLNQQKPARTHRLPAEAEWEYACRAGSAAAFFWGEDRRRAGRYAWLSENSNGGTRAVQTKRPNPWGLYHLAGLVWEWCQDWYGDYLPKPRREPSTPWGRVVRGGSWDEEVRYCRPAYRFYGDPENSTARVGIRLAVSVAPAE